MPTEHEATLIVCPSCGGVNRIADGRDARAAKCGRCHAALFSGKPWPANSKTFGPQISRSDIPVVIDFWADWCGPCKAMAPFFERVCAEMEPHVRFLKLDTEAEPEIAARYNIRAIPTTIIFKNGKVLDQRAGALDAQTLRGWLAPFNRGAGAP